MITNEQTIPRLVRRAAERYGTKIAIEDGDTSLSYSALCDAALQAARAFMALGVQPGDRIAIWAPNIYEWIVAAVGLQSAGGVLVPLNTRYKGAEAGYILKKSGARILCTVGGFLGTDYVPMLREALGGAGAAHPVADLPALERIVLLRHDPADAVAASAGVVGWADFLQQGSDVTEAEAEARIAQGKADDLSDIMFTSGTTGNPKGAMTAHGQNIRAFQAWAEVIGLAETDRYLIVNPFFHSFGYKAGWLASAMCGATMLPHQVFDVPAILARVGNERVSVLPGPPAIYQSILMHPDRQKYDLSCLRLAVTGAAPTPVELIEAMRDTLGFETVITGYGLTECCGIVAMCRYDDDPTTIATTSGRAIPGIEVRCIGENGAEVARGEPGEVVVRGYNVMQGYFEESTATDETIDADGWLHTGDIAVMDDRGYLKITDRIKDMFIMGGFNCYPAEIESLMRGHENIAAVAVIGIPDERMGEVGMAFVVSKPGVTADVQAIAAWCRETMANYKVPRHVEIVDELPVNAMGKVMKFKLRERAKARR